MIEATKKILCVTNNFAYKEQLRRISSSHPNISLIFVSNISDTIQNLQTQRFTLIIIDEYCFSTNVALSCQLLSTLTSLCMNQYTLIIVPRLDEVYFTKYIQKGFTYIVDMATTKYLLPAVLKYIEEFKFQIPHQEKISHKGLILDTQSHYIIFKHCKIHMHPVWIVILHFLIKQNSCCDIAKIQKYLEMIFERSISQSCISANIHRLNKQVKCATGLDIIKNRYGVGYYLVL